MTQRKPGRKPKGARRYNCKLTEDVAAVYRRLGGGNFTLGIERGAQILDRYRRGLPV